MVRQLLSIVFLSVCAYSIAEPPLYSPKGLKNTQNSCFINASLQILHASVDMMSLALSLDHYVKGSLFEQVKAGERLMRSTQKPFINPEKLHQEVSTHLGIGPQEQGDANECLATILTRSTDDDIMKNSKAHLTYYEGTNIFKTALSELFFVHIKNQRTDPNNKKFIGSKPPEHTIGLTAEVHAGDVHLKNCLDRYFGETKEYFRTDPDTLIEGINKRFLHNTQKYLYIMLDRREAHTTTNGIQYIRQNAPTSFPLENLDLSPYFLQKKRNRGLYNLVGCIMHSGNAYHGHYRAYTKLGNQWYLCNDSSIKPISEETIAKIAQQGRDDAHAVVTTLLYELSAIDILHSARNGFVFREIFTICKSWFILNNNLYKK